MIYKIKQANQLLAKEIKTILSNWQIAEWSLLTSGQFKKKFEQSEFHILTASDRRPLALSRINFDFRFRIASESFQLAELVGFVSCEPKKGYGKSLLQFIKGNLTERNIEAIGFCEKQIRPFYTKSGISLLYNKAKYLREQENGEWISPSDYDILDLTLSPKMRLLLKSLSSKKLAYISG